MRRASIWRRLKCPSKRLLGFSPARSMERSMNTEEGNAKTTNDKLWFASLAAALLPFGVTTAYVLATLAFGVSTHILDYVCVYLSTLTGIACVLLSPMRWSLRVGIGVSYG